MSFAGRWCEQIAKRFFEFELSGVFSLVEGRDVPALASCYDLYVCLVVLRWWIFFEIFGERTQMRKC